MGSRGPVPKRSSEQMGHRTKAEKAQVDSVGAVGEVVIPESNPEWPAAVTRWYESLGESGQSQFYESSDWAYAFMWAGILAANVESKRPSAEMFKAWDAACQALLVTESARRRARMEIERDSDGGAEGVTSLDDFRRSVASS